MACPLLNKLPAEIRGRIYEYVLYFDDVPVRHISQLQAFIKKLTGTDGELPFSYERAQELCWVMCDNELPFGNKPIDSSVLRTCKTIYTEGKRRQFWEEAGESQRQRQRSKGREARVARQRQHGNVRGSDSFSY